MALRHIVRALARPVTTTATTRSTGVALAARRGFFDKIEKGPEDPILGLSLAFNAVPFALQHARSLSWYTHATRCTCDRTPTRARSTSVWVPTETMRTSRSCSRASARYARYPRARAHTRESCDSKTSMMPQAEKRIFEKKFNHEYLPIVGLAEFNKEAANLIFGADSPVIKRQLVRPIARDIDRSRLISRSLSRSPRRCCCCCCWDL